MKKIAFLISGIFLFFKLNAQFNCATSNYSYTGYCFEYHPNGNVAAVKEFKNGLASGIWMSFDDKGNLIKQLNTKDKQDSLNKAYEMVSDVAIDGEDIRVAEVEKRIKEDLLGFEDEEAHFVGGKAALVNFIKSNLQYPLSARDKGLHGKVYLGFIIDVDGSVTNVRVIKGVPNCPQCDQEAIRVVESMPKWTPAKNDGKAVKSKFNLPLNFILD